MQGANITVSTVEAAVVVIEISSYLRDRVATSSP
jgi:hypothetical protein